MCNSYEDFRKGHCSRCNKDGNYCIKFGFHSRTSFGEVFKKGYYSSDPIATYLLTQGKSPYCASHYKVSVKVSESEESRRHGGEIGILFMRLRNQNDETKKIQVNSIPVYFSPGSNHTFLTIGDDMSDIEKVVVEYRFKQTFNPLTWRINSPRVYIEYLLIESMEHSTYIKVCPNHKQPVGGDEKNGVVFREDSCHYKRP